MQLVSVAALGMTWVAQAALGELPLGRPMPASQPSRPVLPSMPGEPAYTIYETTVDSVPVREYVTAGGIVFGVAWRGRAHPRLAPVLGGFYEEFALVSLKDTEAGRGRVVGTLPGVGMRPARVSHKRIQGARVVVEKSGHMRALRGRAYVPSLMPLGVRADEIN